MSKRGCFYIPTSNCPDFLRDKILRELSDELGKYKAIIDDINTPARELVIITNNDAAATFFDAILDRLAIAGQVRVQL